MQLLNFPQIYGRTISRIVSRIVYRKPPNASTSAMNSVNRHQKAFCTMNENRKEYMFDFCSCLYFLRTTESLYSTVSISSNLQTLQNGGIRHDVAYSKRSKCGCSWKADTWIQDRQIGRAFPNCILPRR